MSRETMLALNTNTLIGFTDKRGTAWHYREGLQGGESNHYPGAIPVADVERRLFNWEAVSRRVFVEIPATIETMDHIGEDGQPMRYEMQGDRQAVARADTHHVMGMFKASYAMHQPPEWLLQGTSMILGDTMGLSSAGVLNQGAVVWIEASVPETIATPEGVTFRPNLLAATSFDGSLSTLYKRTITNTVCDNTMHAALSEVGQVYRVKHSKHSAVKLRDARDALMMVESAADEFAAEVAALCAQPVTDRQFSAFLESLVPTTEKNKPLTGGALTKRQNKQDALRRLWNHDERVSPWKGNAWGVVQAVNTWGQHEAIVSGASRPERNMANAISGSTEKTDNAALLLLGKVLANA